MDTGARENKQIIMTDTDVALIIEQNRQTHAAIASLNAELEKLNIRFEAHVVEDRRQLGILELHERYFTNGARIAKFAGIPLLAALAAKLGIDLKF